MKYKVKPFLLLLNTTMFVMPTFAATTVNSYVDLLTSLNTNEETEVVLNINGNSINLDGGNGINVGAKQNVTFSQIGNSEGNSWTDTSYNIKNNGTVSISDSYFMGNVVNMLKGESNAGGIIQNKGHIIQIVDSYFDNNNANLSNKKTNMGLWGGVIGNTGSKDQNATIGLIENVIFSNNTTETNGKSAPRGAALFNHFGTIDKINNVQFIGNNSKNNKEAAYGGAIVNNKNATIASIENTLFKGNYALSKKDNAKYVGADGGAIYNVGTINNISGDFLENYVKNASGASGAFGGAIRNATGILGNINAKFEANYAESPASQASGGAIANVGKNNTSNEFQAITKDISGSFRKNYATNNSGNMLVMGGAIYNKFARIDNITANFEENYVSSAAQEARGGAISNEDAIIQDVKGVFTKNSATSIRGQASGGAIMLMNATINSIEGDFDSNFVQGDRRSSGGAINNNSGSIITNGIKGNFINNHAKAIGDGYEASGGAIANVGSDIDSITGTFKENYAESTHSKAFGGALVNMAKKEKEGNINTIKDTRFINNYVKGNSDSAGGAIYNSCNISIKNTLFTNNAVIGGGVGGAIYNEKTLNLENVTFDKASKITINGTEYEAKNDIYNLGTIELWGNNTFASEISGSDGMLNINDGTSTVWENISGHIVNLNKGLLNVGKNGNFDGSNLNVANNASLDIGENTIKVKNLDMKGTLKLNISELAPNSSDYTGGHIDVSEKATIHANTILSITVTSDTLGFKEKTGDIELISGDVVGDFDVKELSNNRYAVTKGEKNGSVIIENTASASDVARQFGWRNSINIATAWDNLIIPMSETGVEIKEKLNELSQHDVNSYMEALTVVAPEVAPIIQQTQTQVIDQVYGAIETRLSGVSSGGEKKGRSADDYIHQEASVWIQGLYSKAMVDDQGSIKGFDIDTRGVMLGGEKKFFEKAKIGVGYAYAKSDVDGFKRSTDVDMHTGLVYGEYKPSAWFINGIFSYGWSGYDEIKNVAGTSIKADYSVKTFGAQALTGYEMIFNKLLLAPEVGLRYIHFIQDGYTDTAEQKVSSDDSDILTGVVGVRTGYNYRLKNGITLTPQAKIAASYDLKTDDLNAFVTLANGATYTVEGEALERFGVEFNAGFSVDVNDNIKILFRYEGRVRSNYREHGGLINFRYNF